MVLFTTFTVLLTIFMVLFTTFMALFMTFRVLFTTFTVSFIIVYNYDSCLKVKNEKSEEKNLYGNYGSISFPKKKEQFFKKFKPIRK